MNERADYTQGLRDLADWLDAHPDTPAPFGQRLLLALSTNEAVTEFATAHNLAVKHDDEGNASAELVFGPVTYRAYGYVNFAEHCERLDGRRAQEWADRTGKTITPAHSEVGAS